MRPFTYERAESAAGAAKSAALTKGAKFIADHIIRVTEKAFDDFAGGADQAANRRMLGVA